MHLFYVKDVHDVDEDIYLGAFDVILNHFEFTSKETNTTDNQDMK